MLFVLALFTTFSVQINHENAVKTYLDKEIKEIHIDILEGYLPADELPNSLLLIPPPPEEGSAHFALDQEMAAIH